MTRSETPNRRAARAGLKRAVAADELVRVAARPVSDEEVLRVHTESHLLGLRDALSSGWGLIDADTFFSPASEEAAWLAVGGAVELCRAVVEGPVRRGLGLLRPPGHHAGPSRSMGFCLLVSLDFDAHRADPLGGLELDADCFGAMATALADHVDEAGHGRLALFLEGGYDLDAIEESVCSVVRALGGERHELVEGALGHAEARALELAKARL